MKSMYKNNANIYIQVLLIIILSIMAVNYLAPTYLNADVILNSIMSLQNVTVFYWGQNRLLNIAPFILSIISDPSINLIMLMFLASSAFFALLYSLSVLLNLSVSDNMTLHNKKQITIFLLMTAVTFLILEKYTLFDFIIWHIEYTFSYLFLVFVYIRFLTQENTTKNYLIYFILLFLATCINNSILLPSLMVFTIHMLLKKEYGQCLILIAMTVLSFALCYIISSFFDGPSEYTSLNLVSVQDNMTKTIQNIFPSLDIPYLAIIFLIISIASFFRKKEIASNIVKINSAMIVFFILWLLLFSNHTWIEMNQFHFRYFFPLYIITIYLLTYYVWISFDFLNAYSKAIKLLISLMLFAFSVSFMSTSFVKISDYNIFKNYSSTYSIMNPNVISFHAGNYWSVWPAVMFDLMNNNQSYGLTFRSQGYGTNLAEKLSSKSKVIIYCHNSSILECKNQLLQKLEKNMSVKLLSEKKISKDIIELTYRKEGNE